MILILVHNNQLQSAYVMSMDPHVGVCIEREPEDNREDRFSLLFQISIRPRQRLTEKTDFDYRFSILASLAEANMEDKLGLQF